MSDIPDSFTPIDCLMDVTYLTFEIWQFMHYRIFIQAVSMSPTIVFEGSDLDEMLS